MYPSQHDANVKMEATQQLQAGAIRGLGSAQAIGKQVYSSPISEEQTLTSRLQDILCNVGNAINLAASIQSQTVGGSENSSINNTLNQTQSCDLLSLISLLYSHSQTLNNQLSYIQSRL